MPVASEVLEGTRLLYIFNLLKANVVRNRRTMTVVLLIPEEAEDRTAVQLKQLARTSDLLFRTDIPGEWGLLLPMSGASEAKGFLNRLFREVGEIKAAVMEVVHPDVELKAALEKMRTVAGKEEQVSIVVDPEFKRLPEEVKVTVLDPDDLFREVLGTALGQLEVPNVRLDIRTFKDGQSFLESGWARSAHPHLVVMNDLLPRQNGLDVLHTLRAMPNDEKFIILMMTRRQSEEDMTYGYESGADGYLTKPFNLRLFEAQVKRLFARLWS
ncbi:response regulator [Bhargavaea ginsengi]|uniref:response regulator transcription factor n=1 Tax=Bhargavaea ginsengi TaxID=426757 RepID=UPI00203ED5DD|nr:response regulator [Bhargavaea ginsengi]MCM3088524.1 response regulator [Bhargavaea ginsengi]